MAAITEGYDESTKHISTATEEQLGTTMHIKNITTQLRDITENLNKQIDTINMN